MQYTLKHIAEMLAKNLGQLEKGELKFEDVHSLTEQSRELYEGLIALRYAIAEKGLKPNDNPPFRIHPGQTSLIDAIDEVVAETNQKNDLFSSMLLDQTEEEEEESEGEGESEARGAHVHPEELERDASLRPENQPAEENNPDSEPTPDVPEVMIQPVGDVEEIEEEKELEGEIEGELESEGESEVRGAHVHPEESEEEIEEEANVSVAPVHPSEKSEPDPNDDSLAAKLSRSPIEDLRKAIGLNQKFQFIRELFDGDASSYDAFVDGVNGSNSLEEAMSLVNDQVPQLASKEEGDEVVEVFMDLIERRFL
ncbi:hypothetical protein [Sanyastnella coralliicola]|uniref:hypothetical protein n=1 Tax=Sanyastnella coralliicola TaxID=3069118 RepID=UPI0027B919DA|nr:hypothetical protein [Longitalea sp. SCSIO 12813]